MIFFFFWCGRTPYQTIVPNFVEKYIRSAQACLCGAACFQGSFRCARVVDMKSIAESFVLTNGCIVPMETFICSMACYQRWSRTLRIPEWPTAPSWSVSPLFVIIAHIVQFSSWVMFCSSLSSCVFAVMLLHIYCQRYWAPFKLDCCSCVLISLYIRLHNGTCFYSTARTSFYSGC